MIPQRLHVWVPEWCGPGGIQAYSRNFVNACAELLPATDIHVVVRNGPFIWNGPPGRVTGRGSFSIREPYRRMGYASILAATTFAQRPDLVILTHLHFAPLARWLQRWISFRYWVVAHGIEAWRDLSRSQRHGLRHAEKILPVSRHTAARLGASLGDGCPPMEYLPNTFDAAKLSPGPKPAHLLRRYGLTSTHRVLLTVARLDSHQRYKGHDRVLHALPRVRCHVPEVRYLISGRGADSTRLRRRVHELGLQDIVTFTGFVPEGDLQDHYRLCDLFVMPSEAEGFGIVFLEALACGRRVIAAKGDGSEEPLLQGQLGSLIDPSDPDELFTTICRHLQEAHEGKDADLLRRTTIAHFGAATFHRRLQELFA